MTAAASELAFRSVALLSPFTKQHCSEERFTDKIEGYARKYTSFSEDCLKYCGRVLKKVEKEFQRVELQQGIRNAFLETVMPPGYATTDGKPNIPHRNPDFVI